MDRISAALILGILALMITSGVIVFDTWLSDERLPEAAEASRQPLVFHNDTSITNNSGSRLWLRAEILCREDEPVQEFEIFSGSIKKGLWIQGEDGWYYYIEALEPAQSTEPLADQLIYKDSSGKEREGDFRLNVEAVDEAWLPTVPSSGIEAFSLFKQTDESIDRVSL